RDLSEQIRCGKERGEGCPPAGETAGIRQKRMAHAGENAQSNIGVAAGPHGRSNSFRGTHWDCRVRAALDDERGATDLTVILHRIRLQESALVRTKVL